MVTMSVKCVVLLGLLAQVAAPAGGAEEKAKAKALLQEGLALDKRGDKAKALEKFQAAYAAYPSPKLWFNIGQVERDLGHAAEAAEAFEKFLLLVPDALAEDKKVAKAAVAQLGKKLGRLQIRCETAGAEVFVDGKKAGQVPLAQPIWAAPGSHQVTITREGFAPASETVEMSAGATALVVMHLVPLAAPAATETPPASEPAPAAPPEMAPSEAAGAVLGESGAKPSLTPPQTEALLPVPSPSQSPPPPLPAPAALDLSAQPVPGEGAAESRPIYKTWWFWTGAAAVIVGAAAMVFIFTGEADSNVPGTAFGNHGVFQ